MALLGDMVATASPGGNWGGFVARHPPERLRRAEAGGIGRPL